MLVTVENFEQALYRVLHGAELVLDTETTGLGILSGVDRMIGVAVLVHGSDNPMYFPFRHASGNLPESWIGAVVEALRDRPLIGHNLKFDAAVMLQEGMPVPPSIQDTLLAAHLANENEYVRDGSGAVKYRSDGKPLTSHALKFLADRYLGTNSSAEEKKLLALLKGKKGAMNTLPAEAVEPYACQDVVLTSKLLDFYQPVLQRWRLFDLWGELNKYALATLRMEMRGLRIDPGITRAYIEEASAKSLECRRQVAELCGDPDVNPKSAPQMQRNLDLSSTAVDVLSALPTDDPRYPLAQALLGFRGWSKVVNTYYQPILETAGESLVIHPNLNITGTVAGRPSCSNPNLQAIPRYTEVYKVKDIFVARPGYVLVSADYSQAEIRWGTHYAREATMAALLISGVDIHSVTAKELGIPRDAAKRINFGVIYGIGAKALANDLGIPVEEAARYLKRYHQHYPGFRRLYNSAAALAERNSYIRMFTGRIRRYDDHSPAHKASSNLIQGAVAEMLRKAIMNIDAQIPEVHMNLQVHDQILFEAPDDGNTEFCIRRVKHLMEDFELGWDDIRIPLIVDFKLGASWGTMTKWAA